MKLGNERNGSRPEAGFGFTLIELLVVIAIIGILASLLLPALGAAKRKARSIKCLSNMRQWGLGISMYMDSHRDEFPYEGNFSGDIDKGKNRDAWFNSVTRYLDQPKLFILYTNGAPPMPRDGSVFSCPETVTKPGDVQPTLSLPFFMYGFNNRMDPNDTQAGRNNRTFFRDQAVQPSLTVMFTENSEGQLPSVSGRSTPGRHGGAANLVFVDGHAELVVTNLFRRTLDEDRDSNEEWSVPRDVYWYPYKGAPR
jgi:prepilin-type N-terminal cleavage/methylation domain-containing protein/prepilin-type processing-associated H-X9-DG protein